MFSAVAVIPARSGSKGIPGKNIKNFLGKPLLEWSVEAALQSRCFNRVLLSTDSEEIARIGLHCGAEVPFLRPRELAQDDTPTAPVIRHVVDWLREQEHRVPEYVAILEPTSPARRSYHVQEAMERIVAHGADTVASVSEVPHHFVPEKALRLSPDGLILGRSGTHPAQMIHRRQDLPRYYAFNGLIFACRRECLMADPPTLWGERVVASVVPGEYAIDLDRPEDWTVAEARVAALLAHAGGRV